MSVYLIRAGKNGPVKIGMTDDLKRRMYDLQVGHWEELTLLRIWEGGETEESALHKRFSDLHIRGEWFHFSRQMLGDVGLVEIHQTQVAPPPVAPNADRSEQQTLLLIEAEDFCRRMRMPVTTFGVLAVRDGKFIPRLRSGANMLLTTMERAREYMRSAA